MHSFSRLLWPTLILLCLTWLEIRGFESYHLLQDTEVSGYLQAATQVLLWLTGALLFNRLLDIFIWSKLVASALQRDPPRLMVQLSAVGVYLAAIAGILAYVFGQSVTAFWATSGAVGIVIGLALQNLILDTFSGLAIHLERPFTVGDWINVHTRMGEFIGRVEETNWRTTRLWTTDRNIVIIPNSFMTTTVVVNFSLPEKIARFELEFLMDYFVPSERVLRVLSAALQSSIGARGPLAEPEPKVRIDNIDEDGVEYKMRYYLDPEKVSPAKARDTILANVMKHMHLSGLSLTYPKRDVYVANMPWRQKEWDHSGDRERQLTRISLLRGLTEDDRQFLAENMIIHQCRNGHTLVTQDDPGSSMFIIAEGLFEVSVRNGDAEAIKVATLEPGDFLGEKSLLTGEPRSATVTCVFEGIVAEITKDAFASLLERNPGVAEVLSQAIAVRDHANQELIEQNLVDAESAINSEAGEILSRLKKFFLMS